MELRVFVKSGFLTKLERPKGEPPLHLRFEWAARRYCLNEPYKEMAKGTKYKYGHVLIRQAVHRINISVRLKDVTKLGNRGLSQRDDP
jgi:hypothetical protein